MEQLKEKYPKIKIEKRIQKENFHSLIWNGSLEQSIDKQKKLLNTLGCLGWEDIKIDWDYDSVYLYGTILESDEEYKARLNKIKAKLKNI